MDKFAKTIVFLFLRSNLSVNYNLNLFGSLVLKVVSNFYILFIRWL